MFLSYSFAANSQDIIDDIFEISKGEDFVNCFRKGLPPFSLFDYGG